MERELGGMVLLVAAAAAAALALDGAVPAAAAGCRRSCPAACSAMPDGPTPLSAWPDLCAGLTQLFAQLLAPALGPQGWLPLIAGVASAALALAAYHGCLRAMSAARSPTVGGGARMIAFISYALCTGVYWLPAGQACCAVGAAMLRCPSLVQLPAALLKPAVLWQLLLVLLACERWKARAYADFATLQSNAQLGLRMMAASGSRFGPWVADFCRYLLASMDAQVSGSRL